MAVNLQVFNRRTHARYRKAYIKCGQCNLEYDVILDARDLFNIERVRFKCSRCGHTNYYSVGFKVRFIDEDYNEEANHDSNIVDCTHRKQD